MTLAHATRAAFENAIAGVAATGGSTNAVLHLLAMAREAGVDLDIDDFDLTPFAGEGGLAKAAQVFGKDLGPIVNELNEALAA